MKDSQSNKMQNRLKIFGDETEGLSVSYQDLADKNHFMGSKYFTIEQSDKNASTIETSGENPIKPPKTSKKNITSAFTGIWSNPSKINIYELLLWREKAIQNCLIETKESSLYAYLVELRDQAINILENKYKDIIDDYLQTLCNNSNKRREIYCGNDLLMSFSAFARKHKYNDPEQQSTNSRGTSAVEKLTRVYLLNKMLLDVSEVTHSESYKLREF